MQALTLLCAARADCQPLQLGNIFQGAVYLSWNTQTLISSIGSAALNTIKTISRHSYPQSACGGASTNLPNLMSHS